MRNLENMVRATLHDVAREARPADLTRAAMAQARRTRRYRLVKFISGLTAVAVAAFASAVLLGGTADQPPPPSGPTTLYYADGTVLAKLDGSGTGIDSPSGLVVQHVLSELADTPSSPWRDMSWEQLRTAGLSVITTLDPRAQRELERVVDPGTAGSLLTGQPEDLQPAAVMVEPGTGRILAYYGGTNGAGPDFAGVYIDDSGEMAGFGRHPPGGSFGVHALAAALQAGYSLQSRWDSQPRDLPGRTGQNRVGNSSTCPGGARICSLADASAPGVETIFYALTVSVSPHSVLAMARDAGIDLMWEDSGARVNLVGVDPNTVVPSRFDFVLGLGQYPVTVVDQANAMATYAAGGVRAQAHFVRSVLRDDEPVWGETLPAADQEPVIRAEALADLTWVLSTNDAGRIEGHDSATKTGNWQYGATTAENAHAWTVGYTGHLALAVWVGNRDGGPIALADGETAFGAGLPAEIYREVMTATHSAMGLANIPFRPPIFIGDVNPAGSVPQ